MEENKPVEDFTTKGARLSWELALGAEFYRGLFIGLCWSAGFWLTGIAAGIFIYRHLH